MEENKKSKIIIVSLCVVIVALLITIVILLTGKDNTDTTNKSETTNSNEVSNNTSNEEQINQDSNSNTTSNNQTASNQTSNKASNTTNNVKTNDLVVNYKTEKHEDKMTDGRVWAKSERSYPIITSSNYKEQVAKISNTLKSNSDSNWQHALKELDNEEPVEPGDTGDVYAGFYVNYKQLYINERYITFENKYEGSLGGTYYFDDTSYETYDFTTGTLLNGKNISTNPSKLRKAVANYVINYIKKDKSLESLLDDGWEKIVDGSTVENNNYGLTGKGLLITYVKSSMGPSVAGEIKVEVPASVVNPYLKNEYKQK